MNTLAEQIHAINLKIARITEERLSKPIDVSKLAAALRELPEGCTLTVETGEYIATADDSKFFCILDTDTFNWARWDIR